MAAVITQFDNLINRVIRGYVERQGEVVGNLSECPHANNIARLLGLRMGWLQEQIRAEYFRRYRTTPEENARASYVL